MADNVTDADIRVAALWWVGQKDRETFLDDLIYAEQNWQIIIPVRKQAELLANHRHQSVEKATHELVEALAKVCGDLRAELNESGIWEIFQSEAEPEDTLVDFLGEEYGREQLGKCIRLASARQALTKYRSKATNKDREHDH